MTTDKQTVAVVAIKAFFIIIGTDIGSPPKLYLPTMYENSVNTNADSTTEPVIKAHWPVLNKKTNIITQDDNYQIADQ